MKKSTSRKRATIHPVAVAVRRAGPIPSDLIEGLRLREWSAIETFAKGNATPIELAMLRELLGMCACSVDLGFGPEAEPTCKAAAAILGSFGKADSSTRLSMNDSQIMVMRELQGYHDLQRAAFTWGDYLRLVDQATFMLQSASGILSDSDRNRLGF